MVIIRFADPQIERLALGYLAGRFSFKTWATGDTMIPEEALAHLAAEGLEFTVKGRAELRARMCAGTRYFSHCGLTTASLFPPIWSAESSSHCVKGSARRRVKLKRSAALGSIRAWFIAMISSVLLSMCLTQWKIVRGLSVSRSG